MAAGHDAFPFHLVETHLAGAWGDLGGYREQFLALGHHDSGGGPMFNMTALAMRASGAINGVSRLHGEVTKRMWQSIWPSVPVEKLPILSITNGVHVSTWASRRSPHCSNGISAELARLARRSRLDRSRDGHPGRRAVGGTPGAAVVSVEFHPRARARGGRTNM